VRELGNLKDKYFLEHLEQRGVELYEAAITLVGALRAQQIKTAVVSSSNNCAKVLETTGKQYTLTHSVSFSQLQELVGLRDPNNRSPSETMTCMSSMATRRATRNKTNSCVRYAAIPINRR
jgi:hypothetical protein